MNINIMPFGEIAAFTANLLEEQLLQKPDSVLGLATGSTPVPFYAECVRRVQEQSTRFSLEKVRSFNLDEYVGLSGDHPQSYRFFMEQHLFQAVGMSGDRAFVPNGTAADPHEECKRYDAMIERSGWIDWQLLGIGHNGHIAFNEPGTALQAGTHVIELTQETREANARFFDSIDDVPTHAITMGMGTIMKAKRIVLLATGADKAAIVSKALTGPITTEIPASFLQLHRDLVVVLDEDAGRLLKQ